MDGEARSSATGSASSSLLRRVQANDPEAWRRLVAVFGPVVYGWARRSGLQEFDAADITQETFKSVSARVGSFTRSRPGDSFRGWLWTIVRNKIRDHHRAGAGHTPAEGGDTHQAMLAQIPETPPEELSASGLAAAGELLARRVLEQTRDEFEPRTWEAFSRVALQGQAPAEVAAALGMSVGAVYMAKSRVLKRLRAELRELTGGE